jgi:hypothetical protein
LALDKNPLAADFFIERQGKNWYDYVREQELLKAELLLCQPN